LERETDQHELFNAAMDEERFADAFRAAVLAVWQKAVRVLKLQWLEVDGLDQVPTVRDAAVNLSRAIDELIEQEGEPPPAWLQVRDAFKAIASIEFGLEGSAVPDLTADQLGTLLIAAFNLGQIDAKMGLWETGIWRDYGEAKFKLHKLGSGQRGRVAEWESRFLPVARAYCGGRSKVTLGELVRHARSWAEAETRARGNPGLPATDDGIKAGLKRMESSGQLAIPGRSKG
jgi:hypothetical protein